MEEAREKAGSGCSSLIVANFTIAERQVIVVGVMRIQECGPVVLFFFCS